MNRILSCLIALALAALATSAPAGVTAMIRARSPVSGIICASNITATVLTSGFITAWCSSPAGIQAACWGGSR